MVEYGLLVDFVHVLSAFGKEPLISEGGNSNISASRRPDGSCGKPLSVVQEALPC